LVLAVAGLFLAACGPRGDHEAETVAAPVRMAVASLVNNPGWKKDKCLCVGLFRGDAVQDFPPEVLKATFASHPWVRNWSECAPLYGHNKGLAQCKGGMKDYICSTAVLEGLPEGTTRVICHVNGKNQLLADEYNVRVDDGRFGVRALSAKALSTPDLPDGNWD
jgi:hypothetical protein